MNTNLRTWSWVLTTNAGEGLPYAVVNLMLVALLADLGTESGTVTAATGLLSLPWALKALWSPAVDTTGTKRGWMLWMQVVMGALLLAAGLSLGLPAAGGRLPLLLAAMGGVAVASATYDVACDGYYMLALSERRQSFFVGIRSMAYRLGMLLASGGLVALAGRTEWRPALFVAAGIFLLLALLHTRLLPSVERRQSACPTFDATGDTPTARRQKSSVQAIVRAFFARRDLGFVLLFLFFYRLGEAFLSKVSILFLKAPAEAGGIDLTGEQYGLIYGTFGILSLTVGGIVGGMAISRYGLRRCIVPMAIMLNLPDLLYVWMAAAQPTSLWTVGACVSFEQLGYGFGLTAYTVYLLRCADGEFRTSHYAFLTALMAIGMSVPTVLSGYALAAWGYRTFFVVACLLTLPSMALAVWYRARSPRQSAA